MTNSGDPLIPQKRVRGASDVQGDQPIQGRTPDVSCDKFRYVR